MIEPEQYLVERSFDAGGPVLIDGNSMAFDQDKQKTWLQVANDYILKVGKKKRI